MNLTRIPVSGSSLSWTWREHRLEVHALADGLDLVMAFSSHSYILWTPIRDMAHREGAAKTEGILIPPQGEKDDKRVLIRNWRL
jgi:hypothetical protein